MNEAFAIVGSIVGLVMCFLGHRLFKFSKFVDIKNLQQTGSNKMVIHFLIVRGWGGGGG